MRKHRSVIGAIAAAALLSLTACGSDEDASSSTEATETSVDAGADDTAAAGSSSVITGDATGTPATDSPATGSPATDSPDTGSGSNGQAADDPSGVVPDACDLLTDEAVAAVLGSDPAPSKELTVQPAPPLNLGQCEWSVDPTELSTKGIYLSVTTTAGLEAGGAGGGGYTTKDLYDSLREGNPGATDVPGLGDEAYTSGSGILDLHVLAGDALLEMSVLKLGSELEDFTMEELRSLMEVALSRL